MVFQPSIFAPVASGIVALALAEGGFPDAVLGVATAAVWLLVGGLLLGGGVGLGALNRRLLALLALFALLAIWTALSLSWAGDSGSGFVDLVRVLLSLGVLLTVGLAARPGTGPSWLAGIAIGGTLVAVLALGSRLLGLGGDEQLAVELQAAAERLSFPIGYWNGLGYLLAMTMPPLVWLAATARSSVARLAVATSIPVVVALFLTSSRGALLAAVLGLLIAGWFAFDRRRLLLAAEIAIAAWTVTIIATAALRDQLNPIGAATAESLLLVALIIVSSIAVYLSFGRLDAGGEARPVSRRSRRTRRLTIAGALVAALAVGIVLGPSAFLGEFRTEQVGEPTAGTADALVSGSGRSSFWGAALSAFGEDPVRGIGAGGFETYWNINGELGVPTRNAHSAELEALAELGLPGGAALLAALGLGAFGVWSRLRSETERVRAASAAVAGIFVAGLVAIGIDWTWELPAALAPFVISLALLCGSGLLAPGAAQGSLLVDSRMAGYEPLDAPASPPPWILRVGIGAAAGVAIWAGLLLALTAIQLDRSADRLARGDLSGAAEAARAVARLEPWSPEPSLRLAEIEQTASNLEAARRRAEEAVRLAPDDFRPWLLLGQIQSALGNPLVAGAYTAKARELAPAVLARPGVFPRS